MSQIILQLKNIVKDYRAGDTVVHALKGVSLSFRKNEFVSVLGQSGCGKTTLLNIIGGLDQYTSGDLIIKGVSTKDYRDGDWDTYRNHSIGFVFQSYNLIPHQTILENVELALTLSGVPAQERKARAKRALERVGLGEHLKKKPNQLSGGQMQRVAIARALVNDPEILLADEPTGALDSETSVQIMDLIKEISGERLVIMVTHNPELAHRYSTRIVELKDGTLGGDSDPPELDGEELSEGEPPVPEAADEQPAAPAAKGKKKKTSMSFGAAFALSGKNLLTKKARTAVTSVAGSIGIVSVCLVLALSNGFSNYIVKTEEDMLSYYPLEINEVSLDADAIMSGLQSSGEMPDLSELDNKVYVNSFLTQIAQGMTVTNDIGQEGYLEYLYAMDPAWYEAIQEDTGVTLQDNLFTTVEVGLSDSDPSNDPDTRMEVMSLTQLKEYFKDEVTDLDSEKYGDIVDLVDYLGSPVHKMPGTSDFARTQGRYAEYVLSQYDIVNEGGYFPEKSDQAVLVVGGNNDLTDILLAELGYISEDDFLDLFRMGEETSDEEWMEIAFDELTAKPFVLYYNDAVYAENENYGMGAESDPYPFVYQGTRSGLSVAEGEGVAVEVTAILRLKDGLSYGCLSDGLNLTEELVDDYLQANASSKIVQWMKTDFSAGGGRLETVGQDGEPSYLYLSPAEYLNSPYYYSKLSQEEVDALVEAIKEQFPILPESGLRAYLQKVYLTNGVGFDYTTRYLGDDKLPNSIRIYPKSFDAKDSITAYLEGWQTSASAPAGATDVRYTDTVGLMMTTIQTLLDTITYVLIAFTAISLVVSTVMIGVITYVSVVERTKEIGILRAMGARKKDIKRVFNAETFIIGLCAGLIGIAAAYLLQVILNLILTPLTGISGLAALPFTSALIMVLVSVALTLISGLIPASAAAKRDPVVALRSE